MGYVHAELMAQYAEDAKKYNEPWKLWQYGDGEDGWADCVTHPSWHEEHAFRRKPRTINLAGYEVPEPVREPLSPGQKFWAVTPFLGPHEFLWYGCSGTQHALDCGFVHLTKEAAEQHFEVLKILLSGATKENP